MCLAANYEATKAQLERGNPMQRNSKEACDSLRHAVGKKHFDHLMIIDVKKELSIFVPLYNHYE